MDLLKQIWLEPEVLRDLAAITMIVWIGILLTLDRVDIPGRQKIWAAILSAGLPFAWFFTASDLALQGVFDARADQFPRIPFVLAGVIVVFFFIFRSRVFQKLLSAAPIYWLLGFQFFRIIGDNLMALYAQGKLPGVLAIPIGLGDVLIGMISPVVAYWYHHRKTNYKRIAVLWSMLGVLDILYTGVVVMFGQTSPIQLFKHLDPSVDLVTQFPVVMEAIFGMPVVMFVYVCTFWRLKTDKGIQAAGHHA
jgi:hypothetical protein